MSVWRGLLTMALMAGIGCQKPEDHSSAGPVKIGVAAPFTGPSAKMGDDIYKGVQLAVADWNARGGVLGRPVEIVRRDDESKPKTAVSIARELINERVVGVIGHYNSGCTIPASEIFAERQIPIITPAATNPQITDRGYRYVFRVCGRDDQQGSSAAAFTRDRLAVKRIAVLHDKTPYGQGLADEYRKAAEDQGLTIAYSGGVSADELDFRAVIAAMKAAQPDLLYFGGLYGQAGPLVVQARAAGLAALFMSGDGVIDQEFLKTAGRYAEGAYLTFGPDPERVPGAQAVLDQYRQRFGEPGPYSVYAYDAANILLTAIAQAGSVAGPEIVDVLHSETFPSAMGQIKYDEKGDITGSYYVMWVVKDGRFVVWE